MTQTIKTILKNDMDISTWNTNFIRPIIKDHIDEVLKSIKINTLVESAVQSNLNSILGALVEKNKKS